jgi:hypothetical protein
MLCFCTTGARIPHCYVFHGLNSSLFRFHGFSDAIARAASRPLRIPANLSKVTRLPVHCMRQEPSVRVPANMLLGEEKILDVHMPYVLFCLFQPFDDGGINDK